LLNGFGEGRREQQHLTIGANISQYAHDLWLKTQVKHSVGLIYDDKGDAAQVGHTTSIGS
jgi:hypothetical protein